MRILIFIPAIISIPVAIVTLFALKKKLDYFQDRFGPTKNPGGDIGKPASDTRKFFLAYSAALIVGSICIYEIFKQFLFHS